MDEKQLQFLNSLESIDWNQLGERQQKIDSKTTSTHANILTKSQKKRAKKKAKKEPAGVNSALLKNVETVVFQNPDSSSSAEAHKRRGNREGEKDIGIDIDLKKARFEVMKFSMNSLAGTEKYDAETALAMSLGAKKEKNKAVNYKELVVVRKEEKRRKEEQEAINAKSKPKPKKEKRKKGGKSGSSDGIVRVKDPKKFLNSNKGVKRKR